MEIQSYLTNNITLIFKKGTKSNTANYRPVSLTVILCKGFESLVRDKMIEHLERFSLIKDTQHNEIGSTWRNITVDWKLAIR